MTDAADAHTKKQRSPSFPFITLTRAVQRAEEFFRAHRRSPARVPDAVRTWGYEVKSSGGLQTVAALKQFGLIEDIGLGDARKLKLSDLAVRILEDKRHGARENALEEAALKPRLLAEYLKIWGRNRPVDHHCISDLKFDKSFNDDAARKFLTVYDDTIGYIRVAASDKVADADEGIPPQSGQPEGDAMEPAIGDTRSQAPAPPFAGLGVAFAEPGKPHENDYKVLLSGGRLEVHATVDLKGLRKLMKVLKAQEPLLEDADDEDSSDGSE